jgi:hypothetical protein
MRHPCFPKASAVNAAVRTACSVSIRKPITHAWARPCTGHHAAPERARLALPGYNSIG